MNKAKVKIEIWESKDGFSPYIDSFKSTIHQMIDSWKNNNK